MLKIAHIQPSEIPEREPEKLSKYDDPAYYDLMKRQFIREHNEKIRKQKQAK